MQHATQIRILDELLAMVETRTSADAGHAVRNPASAYTDAGLARREWQTFFRNQPQLIGLSGDLPEAGSYLTCDDFGVPLLVIRDPERRLRAFVNACRHRGTRLADQARGHATRFTCPFHGWTYGTDGALAAITEAAQFGALDRACHGLIEVPAVERYGMLWVHPQADGVIDVDALLGPLGPEIEHWQIGRHIHSGACTLDKHMNWKLANDTFGETYHFARLHRNTLGNLFHGDALACEAIGRNHRAVFPTRSIAALHDKPRAQWRIDGASTVLYYLFPNIQMTVSERQITLFRIYPHGDDPGHSRTQVSHYFSAEALALIETGTKTVIDANNVYDRQARDGNAIVAPAAAMEIVNSTLEHEDFRMAESTQATVASGALDYLVFGRNEVPLHHFHNTFRAALDLPPLERA